MHRAAAAGPGGGLFRGDGFGFEYVGGDEWELDFRSWLDWC